jgi:UDP-2-acetamido-2-deoxy-ribo-hexuluronate aminotransferase
MSVPFIDLRRFESGFLDRWHESCREISAATQFVGGPAVGRLEERLVAASGASAAVGCANGTDAIQLALRALGVGPGDRVIVPDVTFWATFEAVVNCGASPVTVDIDPQDLQMDFELFRQAVDSQKPRAAILVHLYGWASARLDEFRAFCRQRQLPLIEDAAQAWGVTWGGRSIFEGAEISTLSFYPAKVLGACGDAGAVLCADAEIAERVRTLTNHGRTGHYQHGLLGWNSRLGGFEAAYLELSLDYLPQRLDSRRRAAARYRERLAAIGLPTAGPPEGYVENGYLNVTLLEPDRRPAVLEELQRRDIGFALTYPIAVSKQPAAAAHLAATLGGDEAQRLGQRVLNLPLFAYIRDDEIDEAVAGVADAITA